LREKQLGNFTIKEGCWLWNGPVCKDGYGKVKRFGKTLRAHRVFYEAHVAPIPEGLLVLHRCDTPKCVNPEHLFVGTQLDNERDKDRKKRRSPSPSISHPHLLSRGEKHYHAKLTDDAVREIRNSVTPARTLAALYGVSLSAIWRARNRSFWRHVL
jgi:hypothetical protein